MLRANRLLWTAREKAQATSCCPGRKERRNVRRCKERLAVRISSRSGRQCSVQIGLKRSGTFISRLRSGQPSDFKPKCMQCQDRRLCSSSCKPPMISSAPVLFGPPSSVLRITKAVPLLRALHLTRKLTELGTISSALSQSVKVMNVVIFSHLKSLSLLFRSTFVAVLQPG